MTGDAATSLDDRPAFQASRAPLAFAAGVAIAVLTLFGDRMAAAAGLVAHQDWSAADSPAYGLWYLLLSLQAGLWAVVAYAVPSMLPPGSARPGRLARGWPRREIVIVAGSAMLSPLIVLLLAGFALPAPQNDLPHRDPKILVLTLLGLAFAAELAVAFWIAATCISEPPPGGRAERLHAFLVARARLETLLLLSVLTLSVLVVSSATLRRAILQHHPDSFSPDLIVAYGGIFSILLLVLYLPGYIRAERIGRALLDEYFNPAPEESLQIKEWAENRSALAQLMGLRSSGARTLGTFAGVLTPLAIGLLSALFR